MVMMNVNDDVVNLKLRFKKQNKLILVKITDPFRDHFLCDNFSFTGADIQKQIKIFLCGSFKLKHMREGC